MSDFSVVISGKGVALAAGQAALAAVRGAGATVESATLIDKGMPFNPQHTDLVASEQADAEAPKVAPAKAAKKTAKK